IRDKLVTGVQTCALPIFMRIFKVCLVSALLVSMAYAMPLNSSARTCVPADLLQLISVDYRALKDSPTAMALKQQLMPDNIKQFRSEERRVGKEWESRCAR